MSNRYWYILRQWLRLWTNTLCYIIPSYLMIVRNRSRIEYHVHIWYVSPHVSCGDTRHIGSCFMEFLRYMYICNIINIPKGKVSNGAPLSHTPKLTSPISVRIQPWFHPAATCRGAFPPVQQRSKFDADLKMRMLLQSHSHTWRTLI